MSEWVNVRIKLLRDGVKLPTYATNGSSGMDVRAYAFSYPQYLNDTTLLTTNYIKLKPKERILIKTGLAVALPEGYEIQVRDRSGCALKAGIMLVNGVGTIDADYRGEIGIILYNSDETDTFEIHEGDRVAQLVLQKVPKMNLIVVDNLDLTDRGSGGYNSTGVE